MMAMVGMPARYIFVAPLRRTVWVFTKSHLSTECIFFSPFSTYDTSIFSVPRHEILVEYRVDVAEVEPLSFCLA